jgi:hypothetical protein
MRRDGIRTTSSVISQLTTISTWAITSKARAGNLFHGVKERSTNQIVEQCNPHYPTTPCCPHPRYFLGSIQPHSGIHFAQPCTCLRPDLTEHSPPLPCGGRPTLHHRRSLGPGSFAVDAISQLDAILQYPNGDLWGCVLEFDGVMLWRSLL